MIIRPATEDDITAIHLLEQECMQLPWSRGQVASEFAGPGGVQLVAEDEGVICGYILMMDAGGEVELLRIGVPAGIRNQGVGACLLQAGLSAAVDKGAETCFLEVRRSNLPARHLYGKAGFHTVGVRPRYYKNPVEDAVIMQKELLMSHGGSCEDT